MLIFDKFPSLGHAEQFAAAAQTETQLPSIICLDWDEFDRHEFYPFEVHFPAVLVPRLRMEDEARIEALVTRFGGEFSGT